MTGTFALPARLDTAAAERLLATFSEFTGQDVILNGSEVELLGARCLEQLLTSKHVWSSSGLTIRLEAPSASLVADLKTFGMTTEDLETGEVT